MEKKTIDKQEIQLALNQKDKNARLLNTYEYNGRQRIELSATCPMPEISILGLKFLNIKREVVQGNPASTYECVFTNEVLQNSVRILFGG